MGLFDGLKKAKKVMDDLKAEAAKMEAYNAQRQSERAQEAAARPAEPRPGGKRKRRVAGPHVDAGDSDLDAAQLRRRAGPVQRRSGRPATPGRINSYERLERSIIMEMEPADEDAPVFPWTVEQAREALVEKDGIDRAAADAYLSSDAAKRLLERPPS